MEDVISREPVSTKSIPAGAIGGLAGGVVFGMLMQMMDMLPMVAMLVGSGSVAVGWLVHLAISAFIGGTFALLLGSRAASVGSAAGLGVVYGAVWWVLGALTIMPARLGMQQFMLNEMTLQSLMGHLMYGLVLGIVFALVGPRLGRS
ncbi:MAG: hypothetical protein WD602_01860 [Actinomycetota bacterium]